MVATQKEGLFAIFLVDIQRLMSTFIVNQQVSSGRGWQRAKVNHFTSACALLSKSNASTIITMKVDISL